LSSHIPAVLPFARRRQKKEGRAAFSPSPDGSGAAAAAFPRSRQMARNGEIRLGEAAEIVRTRLLFEKVLSVAA